MIAPAIVPIPATAERFEKVCDEFSALAARAAVHGHGWPQTLEEWSELLEQWRRQ